MNIFNKLHLFRLIATVSVLVLFAFTATAEEEREDSVFTFRFYTGSDKFYAPGLNNGDQLTRLYDVVNRYKEQIKGNEISLRVDGFYFSNGAKGEVYNTAKTRSNRVKSELIVHEGIKEANFVTRNHPGQANYVTVRLFNNSGNNILATSPLQISPITDGDADAQNDSITTCTTPADTITEVVVEEPVTEVVDVTETTVAPEIHANVRPDSRFLLKTNMLAYGILMPNIEVEWKFNDRWSLALEGQRAWYAKEPSHKIYRVATIIPEVRYWVIQRSQWHGMYTGAFLGAGPYDLSKGGSNQGHKGEGAMGGLSVGYMWPISKHLSLDAGLGVGYMRLRDRVYEPRDGHFLYQYTKKINYFGPLRLKLSLVWRIPKWKN